MYSFEWRKFLNNDQKTEVREIFFIFDKNNENRLYLDDIKPAFMALGIDISEEDLERIINNFKKVNPEIDYLSLENFLDLAGMRIVPYYKKNKNFYIFINK